MTSKRRPTGTSKRRSTGTDRRRLPRLGLTTRGSALATAGVTAALCGIALGQRDLVRVALLLVATPLVAALVLSRSRVSIVCQRTVEPDHVAPGTDVIVRITLSNRAVLPTGALMLEDRLGAAFGHRARFTLDTVRGRESRSLAYRLPAVGRGRYRIGPLRMILADPFGLVERSRSFASYSDITVLPQVEALTAGRLPGAWDSARLGGSTSVGTHGSDDASIREYRHGDDLRKVHWRSSARLGSIMVRQEERPWHGRTALLLDTRAAAHRHAPAHSAGPASSRPFADPHTAIDPRSEHSFEWAVSATASIAVHLHSAGRTVDLITGAQPFGTSDDRLLLEALATAEPTTAIDLRTELAALEQLGNDCAVIAVLGSLDEVSLRLLAVTRRARGMAMAMLVDVGAWAPQSQSSRAKQESDLRRAELALSSAGWRTIRVSPGDTVEGTWAGLLGSIAGAPAAHTDHRMPTGRLR